MKSFIIKKWVEPYRLLESIKKFYECKDFTFNGLNKVEEKSNFFDALSKNKYSVGLYMKNVNKYYFFNRMDNFDMVKKIIELFELTPQDYNYSSDIEESLNMVDLGKAEASLILP